MNEWTAFYGNDPDDDYNLTLEILYHDDIVSFVKYGEKGLEMHWYKSSNDIVVPFNWLCDLLVEARERLLKSRDI